MKNFKKAISKGIPTKLPPKKSINLKNVSVRKRLRISVRKGKGKKKEL